MSLRVFLLGVSVCLAACGSSDSGLFSGNDGNGKDAGSTGGSLSGGGLGGTGAVGGGSSSGGRNGSTGGGNAGGSSGSGKDVDASTGGDTDAGPGGTTGAGGTSGAGGTMSTGGTGTGGRVTIGDAGPLGATPNSISCGTTPCVNTSGGIPSVCCALPLAFPPFPTGCFPSFPGCVNTGAPFACDDVADCTGSNVCCGSTTGTSCSKTCGSGKVQFCRTNDECVSGSCRPWATVKEYNVCQ